MKVKSFSLEEKALERKPVKSGENQLPALSGKRKMKQLLFRELGLLFVTTHTNLPAQSRMIRTGPRRGFTSQSHPAPIVERGRLQLTSLPHSKAGRAWRGSARKLRWDSAGTLARRIGLGSLEDAALHWLELAVLTPPSARRWRPGTGNPHLRGPRQRGSASPVSLSPGGSLGVGRGPAARLRPAAVETAHLSLPVAEIRSDGARVRRRRAERSVGSGVRDTKLS